MISKSLSKGKWIGDVKRKTVNLGQRSFIILLEQPCTNMRHGWSFIQQTASTQQTPGRHLFRLL
eukprot:SAG31_NODE_12156_length_962_cov_1.856481_1_plen_63_part_10